MKASVHLRSKSGRQWAAGERALGTTKARTGVLWRLKLVTNPLKHFQSGLKSILIFNWAWKRAIFSKREDQRSTVTSNNCAYSKFCRRPVAAGRMTSTASRTGTGRFSLHFFTFKFRAMATTITYAHVNTRLPEARWAHGREAALHKLPHTRIGRLLHPRTGKLSGRAPRADSTNW